MLAEEFVEGLSEQGLDSAILHDAEQPQLAVDSRGKVATQGFGRVRGGAIGYLHGAPKRVFGYPLRRAARQQLRAQPAWRPHQPRLMNDAQWRSLRCFLDQGHAQPPRPALSDAHRAGDPDWIALGRLSDADRASDFGRALSRLAVGAREHVGEGVVSLRHFGLAM